MVGGVRSLQTQQRHPRASPSKTLHTCIVCLSYMDLKRWITPDRAVWLGSMLALAAYCRDLRYDFILDDEALILLNGTIDSWHNWKLLFLTDIIDSSHSVISNAIHYRPVYMMWLMVNNQLFGKITPWWHLTSLLLHLVVTLLVYRLGAAVLSYFVLRGVEESPTISLYQPG